MSSETLELLKKEEEILWLNPRLKEAKLANVESVYTISIDSALTVSIRTSISVLVTTIGLSFKC